jgi:uncharacterized protein
MSAVQRLVHRAREVCAQRTADVPSPCVSVCRMDPQTQWCEGCFRTIEEIADWAGMEDEGKRQVWRKLAGRALTPELAAGASAQEERT